MLADEVEMGRLLTDDIACIVYGVGYGAGWPVWHGCQADVQRYHHHHHHSHHRQRRQQQQQQPLPPGSASTSRPYPHPRPPLTPSPPQHRTNDGGGADGRHGPVRDLRQRREPPHASECSLSLVTTWTVAKWCRGECKREEEEARARPMAGSSSSSSGGACDCADDGQRQQRRQRPESTTMAPHSGNDSRPGMTIEKTGEVLHSGRVAKA
ncbi:hypothetical protein MAPG_03328 [Magnaporthiopsis poae ATCC 64411]|uniref:Uncharacterized protein n=1 Tax=Magnaporthiopsis poae (strain ATCC 64411 / 73-15) TaxID=644358 RepID=A0A0C4DTQ6_MAGP6|nr:hypothetical protein MAPG_03328 [Magnaporthiopsis poae ATCC 64411]